MKKLGLTMTVAALACAAAQGEIYYTSRDRFGEL